MQQKFFLLCSGASGGDRAGVQGRAGTGRSLLRMAGRFVGAALHVIRERDHAVDRVPLRPVPYLHHLRHHRAVVRPLFSINFSCPALFPALYVEFADLASCAVRGYRNTYDHDI